MFHAANPTFLTINAADFAAVNQQPASISTVKKYLFSL